MKRIFTRVKGNVQIAGLVAGAAATVVASLGTAWATSSKETAVISQRENDHYSEVQKQLANIDKKVDGVNGRLDIIIHQK